MGQGWAAPRWPLLTHLCWQGDAIFTDSCPADSAQGVVSLFFFLFFWISNVCFTSVQLVTIGFYCLLASILLLQCFFVDSYFLIRASLLDFLSVALSLAFVFISLPWFWNICPIYQNQLEFLSPRVHKSTDCLTLSTNFASTPSSLSSESLIKTTIRAALRSGPTGLHLQGPPYLAVNPW